MTQQEPTNETPEARKARVMAAILAFIERNRAGIPRRTQRHNKGSIARQHNERK